MDFGCRNWWTRLRNTRGLVLFNLIILVFAAGVFLYIADEVTEHEHQDFENRIMHSLRSGDPSHPIGPTWVASAARDITAMGSTVVLGFWVVLATGYLAFTRRNSAALLLLAGSIGGLALNTALKQIYDRSRPDVLLQLVETHSLSFPSGHAMSSATIYLTTAVLLMRLTNSHAEKFYLLGAALLVSFVVGLSRIYLGVHYPSDVIAGWAAGVVWAQVCWFAVQFIARRQLAEPTENRSQRNT